MGLGLSYGSPNHHLSPDWYATGDKLAYWIEREIPSFERGIVPVEYTEALVAVLRKHRVPSIISQEAFARLAKKRIHFDVGRNAMFLFYAREAGVVSLPPTSKLGIPQPSNMRPIGKWEIARSHAQALDEYERKYVLAIKTNNEVETIAILAKALALLWELAKAHGEALQAGRNEIVVEFDEFNAAVERALNPGMLRTNIRYMSREEFMALKNAPTPDFLRNVTIRFAQRVTTRTLPAARRTRR